MESIIFDRPNTKPIEIRKVWQHNLEHEFDIIRDLIHCYPYISMDTEFPGVIHKPDPSNPMPPHLHPPRELYDLIKRNVDDLELVQLGLTLSDYDGNLPDCPGTYGVSCIWEFNFRDFDPEQDPHDTDSISFLKRQGINLNLNREFGICSTDFGWHLIQSGLLNNKHVTWVTFQSAYDFAYLVKIITRTFHKNRRLPRDLDVFMKTLRNFFGHNIYDIKHVMKFCGNLYGGLERVASTLGVDREAGSSHLAGSDSLLIWRVFVKMRDTYFEMAEPEMYAGVVYSLGGSAEEILEDDNNNNKQSNNNEGTCKTRGSVEEISGQDNNINEGANKTLGFGKLEEDNIKLESDKEGTYKKTYRLSMKLPLLFFFLSSFSLFSSLSFLKRNYCMDCHYS